MQPSIVRRLLSILPWVAGILLLQATGVQAQHRNYVPTPGLDKVRVAINRLENIGSEVGKEARQALLSEGKAILELEQQYYDGNMPIVIEAEKADTESERLNNALGDLDRRIRDFNAKPGGTQQEADKLNRELEILNAQLSAHKAYVENDLDARIAADTRKLVERYTAFVRNADKFLVSVVDASVVKAAMARGERPPFNPAWNFHQHNRNIAGGLAPEENRCSLVLSLTLDLKPRRGEASLKDVMSVIPEVQGADIANRYVRAQELANRLTDVWGKPEMLAGEAAEQALQNRKGVIFFEGGYGSNGEISHIDLWDGNQEKLGDEIPPHFKQASRIWFWKTNE